MWKVFVKGSYFSRHFRLFLRHSLAQTARFGNVQMWVALLLFIGWFCEFRKVLRFFYKSTYEVNLLVVERDAV
jgi:hypothetical protein